MRAVLCVYMAEAEAVKNWMGAMLESRLTTLDRW
jgi:hypothetical protein